MIHRVINAMVGYFQDDVRRINHALKVHGFAHALSGMEGLSAEEKLVVDLAAVLHDIGIKEAERKYNSSAGKYQEVEGPPIARGIMEALGVEAGIADRVCYLIGHHHSYHKIDGPDFQILVEADFLVNIYEGGMSRNAIESVRNKYFKTGAGIRLMETMYLNNFS